MPEAARVVVKEAGKAAGLAAGKAEVELVEVTEEATVVAMAVE